VVNPRQIKTLSDMGVATVEIPQDDHNASHYDDRMLIKALRSLLEGWEVHHMCQQKRAWHEDLASPVSPLLW